MGKLEIVMLIVVIIALWFFKIVYKNRYEDEFELAMKYMDFSFKLSNDNLKLLKKNLDLHEENKKLIEQLKQYKDSNRVVKVIKEEKQ